MGFYNDGGSRPPRQMVQGNWQCAECGATITELPFEPAPDKPVHCRDCWAKKRERRGGGYGGGSGGFRQGGSSRPMVQGNWKCAGCGVAITQLPFEPSAGRDIFCRDCYRKNRG